MKLSRNGIKENEKPNFKHKYQKRSADLYSGFNVRQHLVLETFGNIIWPNLCGQEVKSAWALSGSPVGSVCPPATLLSRCISSKTIFHCLPTGFTFHHKLYLCPLSSPEALCGLFVKSTLSLNLTWHVSSSEIAADESLDLQIKHPLKGLSGPILYS